MSAAWTRRLGLRGATEPAAFHSSDEGDRSIVRKVETRTGGKRALRAFCGIKLRAWLGALNGIDGAIRIRSVAPFVCVRGCV